MPRSRGGAAANQPRWLRVLLVVLAALVVLFAAWWWLGDPSSTTPTGSTAAWTAYAWPRAAPAVARLQVTPRAPGRHDRVMVRFTSPRATGVFGHERRSYRVRASSARPASACVNQRERFLPARPAGFRLRAALDPARGEGGPLGWCRGRFEASVRYIVEYACPAAGTCHPPEGFRRRSSIAARFSFVVR